MKKTALLLALILFCLQICACGAPVTVAQEITIIGEWVCVGDETNTVYFDESSICTMADGTKAKYKFRVDFDQLMIFGEQNLVFTVVKENDIYMLTGTNNDLVYVREDDHDAAYAHLYG